MITINSVKVTLLLIRYILLPSRKAQQSFLPASSGTVTRIPPEECAAQLPALDSCVRPDGVLELLYEGALAPAAPFLLFHLKRSGYSNGKAVITPEGIKLTARR